MQTLRPRVKIKQKKTQDLSSLISKYKVVGIVNLMKMPSRQLHDAKAKLYGKAQLKVSKKSTLMRALEQHPHLKPLLDYMGGQPALFMTNDNPFKLYAFLQKNKSKASAKAGDIATKEITVPAGITNVQAGPAIGIFKQFKLETKVTQGKIEISKDKVVARPGDTITPEMSSLFQMLGLEPMEISLDLQLVVEGDMIYKKDVLGISEDALRADIVAAYWNAINLSVNAGIINKQNAEMFVQKAHREAKAVASEAKLDAQDNAQTAQPQ